MKQREENEMIDLTDIEEMSAEVDAWIEEFQKGLEMDIEEIQKGIEIPECWDDWHWTGKANRFACFVCMGYLLLPVEATMEATM